MAAAAPSVEEILKTAHKKAVAHMSHIRPPSYTTSYSSSDYDEETIPPIGPEQKRFIQKCLRRALEEGDIEYFQAMPVVYRNQNPHHEQLSYEMVKELRKSVKENGLHSSFTMNLLNAIAEGYNMLPVD